MKIIPTSLISLLYIVILAILVTPWHDNKAQARSVTPLTLPVPVEEGPAFSAEETQCLVRMVYSEAGGESFPGKVAVAATAVTRSLKAGWPNDLCSVIEQRGQFTTRATLRSDNKLERIAWAEAEAAALRATEGYGTLPESYRQSVFFHSGEGTRFASWADVTGRIGGHTFYEART